LLRGPILDHKVQWNVSTCGREGKRAKAGGERNLFVLAAGITWVEVGGLSRQWGRAKSANCSTKKTAEHR